MNGLCIPNRLRKLVCQLAWEHHLFQMHQLKTLGHDHPQAGKARELVEQARQLAQLCGISSEGAA